MKCVLILAAVLCVMVAHVQSQAQGKINQRQVIKGRSGGGLSMLPLMAMAKGGKMNPAMLSMMMSRGGRGGMNNFLPYYLMAEGGMGEGMLPLMALMGQQGGAGGSAGGSNLMNAMLFGGMFN